MASLSSNKNISRVVNGYRGTAFDPVDFEHRSFYNHEKERIEMWLRVSRDIAAISPYFQETIKIKKGETIHTENSHKYTLEHINEFSVVSG